MSSQDDALAEAQRAEQFLLGLAEAFGVSATAASSVNADHDVDVQLIGEDLGALIGPRGTTLAAIQDITRVASQRGGRRDGRLFIDIGGYRQHRKDALIRFTTQVAGQVVEAGQRRILEPMSAPDRKIVHDTVQSIDGVSSRSEGEDPRRCVVIEPA